MLAKNKPIKYNQKWIWIVKLFSREQLQILNSQTIALLQQQNILSYILNV